MKIWSEGSWLFLSENEGVQKEPKAHVLTHTSIELEVKVLEEIPWGTRPSVGAKTGRREKASRAA